MEAERLLSAAEVEEVLSAISSFRLDPRARAAQDAHVFEALRYGLRAGLAGARVADAPGVVGRLREALRERFLVSLVTPGVSESSRAAAANIEPLTQAVLKAAQSTGSRDAGNPIREILTMTPRRAAEYVYCHAAVRAGASDAGADIRAGDPLPPPEWYCGDPRRSRAAPGCWKPPGMDDLLAGAMDRISPPLISLLVRGPRGSAVRTLEVPGTDPAAAAVPPGVRRGEGRYVVHLLRFSMVEALKLRFTPHRVLAAVREHLAAEPEGYRGQSPCSAALLGVGPEHFELAVWAPDTTVSLAAAHGVAEIGAGSEHLQSFEILQTPVLQAVTAAVPLEAARLGLLAPRRADGAPARAWTLHLANPAVRVPATHLALHLSYLGLQLLSCDRNAAGRCHLLRVAEDLSPVEGELLRWAGAEAERRALWSAARAPPAFPWSPEPADAAVAALAPNLPPAAHDALAGELRGLREYAEFRGFADRCAGANPPAPPPGGAWAPPPPPFAPPITTWRAPAPDPAADYATHRLIRYRGDAANFLRFMGDPHYDWRETYTNLIPLAAEALCTYVARQIFDREWTERVANGKVVQAYVDYLSAYGCGTGPVLQAVKHTAIGAGGPLAAIGENPGAVCTNAAISSRTYTTSGSQAEIITGATSRQNGATAVTVVPVAALGAPPTTAEQPPPPREVRVVPSAAPGRPPRLLRALAQGA